MQETAINMSSTYVYDYKELITSRIGVNSSGMTGLNTTALNLKGFIDSVNKNKGYYIARYEASYGVDGKANSKISNTFSESSPTTRQEGMLWNFINQIDAAQMCRNIYGQNNTSVETDLVNSYAWDTAVTFIQEFSEDKTYSKQNSLNKALGNTGNLGQNILDEKCKINDMASNMNEWTTEYSNHTRNSKAYPCPIRGGYYSSNNYCTSGRSSYPSSAKYNYIGFRSIVYLIDNIE